MKKILTAFVLSIIIISSTAYAEQAFLKKDQYYKILPESLQESKYDELIEASVRSFEQSPSKYDGWKTGEVDYTPKPDSIGIANKNIGDVNSDGKDDFRLEFNGAGQRERLGIIFLSLGDRYFIPNFKRDKKKFT
jgi:hypothetical protein